MREDDHDGRVVDEDNVTADSFSRYPSSPDDKTRVDDDKKELEDFHLYKETDDNHDNDEKE